MVRHLTFALAALGLVALAAPAQALNEAEHPHDYPFSFESPVGHYDMGAVQRGFEVYRQVCSNCHSMNALAYRHLGEPGGPFAAYRVRNEETGEDELRIGLPHGHHGKYVDVVDNPWVRSIASGVTVTDIDPASGQPHHARRTTAAAVPSPTHTTVNGSPQKNMA